LKEVGRVLGPDANNARRAHIMAQVEKWNYGLLRQGREIMDEIRKALVTRVLTAMFECKSPA